MFLLPGAPLTVGANVSLSLDILGHALAGTVLEAGQAGARLRFNLDAATSDALAQALDRITARKAA